MGKTAGDLIDNGQVVTDTLDTDYFYIWRSSGTVGVRDQMLLRAALPLRWPDLIGCQCSPGTDSDHDIDISAGRRRDSTDTTNLDCPAGTASIDATFNASASTWGLYSGGSLSADDTVYLMAVSIDSGGVGYYLDTDISGANLPSGCTYFRRIGAWRILSGPVLSPAKQFGNYFELTTAMRSYNSGSPVTTQTSVDLDVPSGLSVRANIIVVRYNNGPSYTNIGSPYATLPTPASAFTDLTTVSSTYRSETEFIVPTDSSAHIDYISSTSDGAMRIRTRGWYDDLGAFDGI